MSMKSVNLFGFALTSTVLAGAVLLSAYAQGVDARVTRFVVEERVVVSGGRDWGNAGPYERVKGTAYMEVNPGDPLNAVIFNLDKATRNARGLVEFNSPFLILKPVDVTRGNQKIWYGVNNRGNCQELPLRAFPLVPFMDSCNPLTDADIGATNPLLTQGYVFVDAGWHGDGIEDPARNRLFPNFPVATQPDGSPIVGPLRMEYQTTSNTFTQPIIAAPWRRYEPADTNTAHATLTVRDREDAPKVTIASDRWAFGNCPTGQASLVPTTTDLCLFDGFAASKIYELIYSAKNPTVMGLAYAVTRDVGSFLRYSTQDDVGNPNPLAVSSSSTGIRRAYVSGTSSTGMYMREFLYLGFNEDELHRKVFEAATIYSAGTHRLFANVQFAHPTFYSRQDDHHDYTSNSIVPLTFAVTTDPVTGVTDGILKRPAFDPLVIEVDEEMTFWQWQASLNVIDGAGNPVPIPDNVRLYYQSGMGHIGSVGLLAPPQPAGICQRPTQGLASLPVTLRALVQVIDDWADRGIEPPKNNYPQSNDLVSLATYRSAFPAIPGLPAPEVMNALNVLDFGPSFGSTGGNQIILPPFLGQSYRLLVPRPTQDGSSVGGINTIHTRVPLGTNVGWNIRAGARVPDLCGLSGSYVPLATTRAERLATGDSRPSLEERYGTHGNFVFAVSAGAKQLVSERFMLPEDARQFFDAAQASSVLH
jgi:hypothetical protein